MSSKCHPPDRLRRVVPVFVCLAMVLCAPLLWAQSERSSVLLEYALDHHMLAEQDPQPLLRVFSDGRVAVHFPKYMSRAGDYEMRLSGPEVGALLSRIRTDLSSLDLEGARSERASIAARRAAETGIAHHISDVTVTIIRYRNGEQMETVRWPNVYTDARFYPELTAVQVLSATENRLRGMLEHEGLVRVEGAQ